MRFLSMFASLALASIALGAPNGGAPTSAPRVLLPNHAWIATASPTRAAHPLLVLEDSIVVTPEGDQIDMVMGELLLPGFVLMDGAAMHLGMAPTRIGSVYGALPEAHELHPGETLYVSAPAGPSAPQPGVAPNPPAWGCSVACPGRACCYVDGGIPYCRCLTPQEWQVATYCQSGGLLATGCTITASGSPPTTPGGPAPGGPAPAAPQH